MRNWCSHGVLLVCGLIIFSYASASPLDTASSYDKAIGQHIQYVRETARISIDEVVELHARGGMIASASEHLNFGIGSAPVWLALAVVNTGDEGQLRRLSIETSWLDNVDFYIFHEGQQTGSVIQTGDGRVYSQRPVKGRFFAVDHNYLPGSSTVFIRLDTADPLILQVYFRRIDEAVTTDLKSAYFYGFLYGVILALLVYNLLLFISIGNSRYLLYSIYLLSFIAMNVAYTGHGYRWLWPNSRVWQMWSNPVFMTAFCVCGLAFAITFLDTKKILPRVHKAVVALCIAFSLAQGVAIASSSQVVSVLLAFCFMFIFTLAMLLLGIASIYQGSRPARYFFFATLIGATSASITGATVWGLIPYGRLSFLAIDIGMMIEAVLLALALADQMNSMRESKGQAEQLARLDPLTGINNRRSFDELIAPVWSTGMRNHHDMSIILLDADHFKDINDTYGHRVGDGALKEIASTLRASTREGDVLARWGGEEFVVFLPETSLSEAVRVAQRYRDDIQKKKLVIEGNVFSITVSLGVSSNSGDSESIESLVDKADKQLYCAKRLGRNQVSFDHSHPTP